ncbi:hypothetical protein [Persicitalea jodogahamensis]|uniref:Universal stress protein n=1 Tax=Persicitalea jodogahamensis TaxID=402147 RepID=A0A8J3D750_9BACT|nr:hypothetical protein [Persicitalea jodogahamensis]GHB70767.1 hypothetical protein GCM10007390_25620 [Persicitalea jodogahamensis]
MKTILIPTDFTIESLNTLKEAIKLQSEKVNVVLVYFAGTPDSITEMLFFSKENYLSSFQSERFQEACQILLNTYASKVNSFRIELFSGFWQRVFTSFLEINEVDEVFIPKNYSMKLKNPRSFDPLPYFRKCALPKRSIPWDSNVNVPEKDRVAELFLQISHA